MQLPKVHGDSSGPNWNCTSGNKPVNSISQPGVHTRLCTQAAKYFDSYDYPLNKNRCHIHDYLSRLGKPPNSVLRNNKNCLFYHLLKIPNLFSILFYFFHFKVFSILGLDLHIINFPTRITFHEIYIKKENWL